MGVVPAGNGPSLPGSGRRGGCPGCAGGRRPSSSSPKRWNQGCSCGLGRQDVLEHARALAPLLRPSQDGLGEARPVAHHAEGVADGEERRGVVGRGCGRTAGRAAPARRGPRGCPGCIRRRRRSRTDRGGPGRRCRGRARSGRRGPPGSCRCGARRTRARARGRRCPRRGAGARRRCRAGRGRASRGRGSASRGSCRARRRRRVADRRAADPPAVRSRVYSNAPQGASAGRSEAQKWALVPGSLCRQRKDIV